MDKDITTESFIVLQLLHSLFCLSLRVTNNLAVNAIKPPSSGQPAKKRTTTWPPTRSSYQRGLIISGSHSHFTWIGLEYVNTYGEWNGHRIINQRRRRNNWHSNHWTTSSPLDWYGSFTSRLVGQETRRRPLFYIHSSTFSNYPQVNFAFCKIENRITKVTRSEPAARFSIQTNQNSPPTKRVSSLSSHHIRMHVLPLSRSPVPGQ